MATDAGGRQVTRIFTEEIPKSVLISIIRGITKSKLLQCTISIQSELIRVIRGYCETYLVALVITNIFAHF